MEDRNMNDQVQVTLNRKLYDRLLELEAPPYGDINAVIDRLLFHAGRGAPPMAADERHYTYAEELERAATGVYDGSGIAP